MGTASMFDRSASSFKIRELLIFSSSETSLSSDEARPNGDITIEKKEYLLN